MNLTDRAMLVNLSISFWQGRKKNKIVTDETITSHRAEDKSGAWWTYTIPRYEVRDIYSAINQSRRLHDTLTLPWSNDGSRILPSGMFLEYSQKMRKAKQQFDAAVNEFLGRYPEIVANAKHRLGELYEDGALPPLRAVREKFRWSLDYLPMPSTDDFRVALSEEDANEVKANIESHMQAITTRAMRDLWDRLYAVIEHMAERIADPKAILRQSLIKNISEMCDMLPKLNITNDSDLEAMRRQVVRKFVKLDVDDLRDSESARAAAAKDANEVMAKMQTFLGGAK